MIEEWNDPREGVDESELVTIEIVVYQVMPGGERRQHSGPIKVTHRQAANWELIRHTKGVTFTEEVLAFEPRPVNACLEHCDAGDYLSRIYRNVTAGGVGAENYLVKLLEDFDLKHFEAWLAQREVEFVQLAVPYQPNVPIQINPSLN